MSANSVSGFNLGNMNGHIINLDTVEMCNKYLNVESHHKLVSVINLDDIGSIIYKTRRFGVYGIILNTSCEEMDADKLLCASMQFISPGYVGRSKYSIAESSHGWLLLFHADIMRNTMISHRLSEYRFFTQSPVVLYLTTTERDTIINCMNSIKSEILSCDDQYKTGILVSGIAVLLLISMRFYDRQFSNSVNTRSIVARLDKLLNDHLAKVECDNDTLPTVAWCARHLGISANYFGDLVKKNTGYTAQEYIQRRLVAEVKVLLKNSSMSISEIAYYVGYKYPHHLTRVFKRIEGCTPNEYKLKD